MFAADKAGLYFLLGSNGLALFWNALLVKWQLEHYGLMNLALIITFASDTVALLVNTYIYRCRNQMEDENKNKQPVVEHEKQYNGSLTRCAAYLKERSTSFASVEDAKAATTATKNSSLWHPLTFQQHFAPLSNCVAVVTHVFFWLSITAVSFVPSATLGRTWEFAHTGAKLLLLDLQFIGFEESSVGFIGIFGGAFTLSMLFVVNAIYFIHFPDRVGRNSIKSMHQTNKFARGINLFLTPVVNWVYMGLISVFVRSLFCSDAGLLIAAEEVECFQGWHTWMIPFSFIGICCLQIAVVLTRPLFQAHDWRSTVTFKMDTHFHINKKNEELETNKKKIEMKTKQTESVLENLRSQVFLTGSKKELKECEEKHKELEAEMNQDKNQMLEEETKWDKNRELMVEKTEEAREYLKTSTDKFQYENTMLASGDEFIAPAQIDFDDERFIKDIDILDDDPKSKLFPRYTRYHHGSQRCQRLFQNEKDGRWYVSEFDSILKKNDLLETSRAGIRSIEMESLTSTTWHWELATKDKESQEYDWGCPEPIAFKAEVEAFKFMFDYDFIFWLTQVQTFLAIAATLFADSAYVVLFSSLAADFFILAYVFKKTPCSVPSVNVIAIFAYGFSLWVNVATLISNATGNSLIGSAMLFCYVALVCLLLSLVGTKTISVEWLVALNKGQIEGGVLDALRSWSGDTRWETRMFWGFIVAWTGLLILWTSLSPGQDRGIYAVVFASIVGIMGFSLLVKLVIDPSFYKEEMRMRSALWVMCLVLCLSGNFLALTPLLAEDFEGSEEGGTNPMVIIIHFIMAFDFVSLLLLTCWQWRNMGKSCSYDHILLFTL
jgi:hypothetical protein